MANWTVLKAAIADVIKTNGNQEITGAVLQNTLNSIVNAVGENATLVGVATPTTNPGTPDGNVFYFAAQAGTYTNFGSVVLHEGLNILLWNGASWAVTNVMNIMQELGTSENAAMSQKSVTKEINGLNSNTGVADYPTFSESTAYSAGDVVNYNGLLYRFTSDHAAAAWTGTDVEPWNISKKNKSDFLIEVKRIPSISNRGYNDSGKYTYTSTACLTYCLDVSKISHVEFSQRIYTSFSPVGNYAFFNNSLTKISGGRPNKVISENVPRNAKFLIFTCAKGVAETLNIILTGANYDYFLSVDDIVLIDGLWNGECYNLSFFGEVENEKEKLKANVIAVTLAQSDIINKIRFKNADTNNEHILTYLSGDKSKISSWEQSETDVEREYYLKKQNNNDGSFSFFFEEDEIMCDAELFFFPAQTAWNNGVTLKDKGGNIMVGTRGRNNNMPSATAHPYTHEVLIPSGYVSGLNGINVYMKKPLMHEYTEPTTPNLVRQDMMNKYNLSYSEGDNVTNNSNYYVREGAACSAIYIPIKPLTRYIAIASGNRNYVAGSLKPDYPLICMDKDKNIIKAYSKNDVKYTNGSSSFGYGGLFIFETPENAAYVSLVVFKGNEAPSEGFNKLNVVISSFDEIVEAVRGSGSSAENVGVVTGKEFDGVVKRTQKSIWILGDSISATGYGGTLTAPISSGSFGGWVKYFIDIIKPYAVANAARGGYTITDASNTFSGEILQNAEKSYIKELEDLLTNYESELIKAPDYMLIVGCTNDFGKTRLNPNGWSQRSFVMDEDLNSKLLNPNDWDYDTFMEHKFISDESNNIIPINNVPMFKLAGAIRYLIQRVGTLFPNCRYMICTSLQAPSNWLSQNQCNKEIKWIANRLSIPVIDVSGQGNTPMLWDMKKQDETQPRRFINDGFHPYGASDSEGVSFITAGAAYQGKLIAEAFKYYCQIETEKDINVVDYTDETGYPHDNNNNVVN